MIPRGIRNNNPLNIRRTLSVRWQGQADEQNDLAFVQFRSMQWGIRAAYCLFATYARRYGCTSPREIITRWAPPSENRTEQYIRLACQWSELQPDERLTPAQWPRLARAMARMETGETLETEIFAEAYGLYLKTKTNK